MTKVNAMPIDWSELRKQRGKPCIERLDPALIPIFQRMTPAERWEQAFQCHELVRARLIAFFGQRHPDWTESQIRVAVSERLLHGTT